MKQISVYLLAGTLLLFVGFLPCVAQTATPTPATTTTPPTDSTTAKKMTAADYEAMVKKVRDGDMSVDFQDMRLAFTETKQYSPYGGTTERTEMFSALREKNYEQALSLAEKRMKDYFIDLHAQYVAAVASKQLNKTEKAEFHAKVFKKMMDDIFKHGDGLTAKTAILAIGVPEQYFIMDYLGFQRVSKSLAREGSSIFDVHDAKNGETNETRKFYFNIDKVFGRF
jgi:Domain of unknown function (DUF4919)